MVHFQVEMSQTDLLLVHSILLLYKQTSSALNALEGQRLKDM